MGFLNCVFPCCVGELRKMVAFLSFFGMIVSYCHRSVLNIGIVEMNGGKRGNKTQTICPPPPGVRAATIRNIGGGDVGWSNVDQSLILASFFIGYVIMHVPAGIICDKWGARWPMIVSFIISTVGTGITPFVSIFMPWWAVFILRALIGTAQGFHVPGFGSLVGQWTPPQERARVSAMVFAAGSFGSLLGNLITGMMIRALENWVYPFYFWTLIGGLYVTACMFYLYSSPETDPNITSMERTYLQQTMAAKSPMSVPVRGILTDPCIYGLIMMQFAHSMIVFILANNLPKYLNNVLGFDIFLNSISALLYVGQWICAFVGGLITDHLVKKRNANVSFMRKINTVISNVLSGAFLVVAGECRCAHTFAVLSFGMALFWKGLFFPGMKVNIIDVTVNHNGLVMSLVNGVGAIAGFISSYMVALIAPDNTHAQWRIVFLIEFAIQVVAVVFYVFMSSSTRRKWDYPEGEQPPVKKKSGKWYLEMTASDHAQRLERDAANLATRAAAAEEAKNAMKQYIADRRAAKRAAREAARQNN